MVDLQPSPVKKEAEWRVEAVEANWRGVEAQTKDAQEDKETTSHLPNSQQWLRNISSRQQMDKCAHHSLWFAAHKQHGWIYRLYLWSDYDCYKHISYIYFWLKTVLISYCRRNRFISKYYIYTLFRVFFKFCIFSHPKKERDTIPSYSPIIVTETLERDHYTIKHQQIKRLC